MESDTNGFRPSTFLEFDKRYREADKEQDQKWLNSARSHVHELYNLHTFPSYKKKSLLSSLEQVAFELADKTMVDSAISNESSHEAEDCTKNSGDGD